MNDAKAAENPEVLTATLRMDEVVRAQLKAGAGAVAVAESFTLDPNDPECDEIVPLANQELISIRSRAKAIEAARVSFVAPARQIIESAQNLFLPALQGLASAEAILKDKLLAWQKGKERIAAEKKAKAEAEARRIQQEAEAKAAAERARAEERERAAREKAAAAEEARKKAAEEAERLRREGDAKAAAEQERIAKAQAAERARQEEAERVAREEADRKAREATLKAAAEAEAHRQSTTAEPSKVAGFSSRDKWIAELEEGKTEDEVKLLICKAIISNERTELLTMFKLDMAAANKLAAAQKALARIPGMKVRNAPIGVSRGK